MDQIITYRLANDLDIGNINSFYNSVYKKNRSYEQFYWEYNSAPAGKAIYVIAECDGKVVATQCAIPYYIIKNNTEILTAKSEDTLVSPDFRGKNIFENMYKLLIQECINHNIVFIWGFTYADKPFKKLGFDIPFKSTMGLLTLKPKSAAKYFYSITAKKGVISYLKIFGLSLFSFLKFKMGLFSKTESIVLDFENITYTNADFSYLKSNSLFGLKLDKDFLDYRIKNNPYNSNYYTVNYSENGALKASIKFNITNENVGYIIHSYFADDLSYSKLKSFIINAIKQTKLNNCIVIRFWGFEHNIQNRMEIESLKKCNFVFLNRGISFVGLKLDRSIDINFSDFVLSRMASQGTD